MTYHGNSPIDMCVNQLQVKKRKGKKKKIFFLNFLKTKAICNGSEELATVFSVRLERKPALSGST